MVRGWQKAWGPDFFSEILRQEPKISFPAKNQPNSWRVPECYLVTVFPAHQQPQPRQCVFINAQHEVCTKIFEPEPSVGPKMCTDDPPDKSLIVFEYELPEPLECDTCTHPDPYVGSARDYQLPVTYIMHR